MTIRHGYYATWHGTEYEASPDGNEVRLYVTKPTDGFTPITPKRHVKAVPAEAVERLDYVSTFCTWQGERFLVLGEHDDWMRVEYVGGKAPVAERLELEMFDRGVYQAWAPGDEIEDVHEETV